MSISEKDVKHIAKLAQLKLADEEVKLFQEQLNKILEYMKILNKVDTANVEPTYHTYPLQNVARNDSVKTGVSIDDIKKMAPSFENGMFKIPKILES